jgi:hypothetical protein
MSNSWNTEQILRDLATDLYTKASELEGTADILRDLREGAELDNRYKEAKARAKQWLERK